jgi:NADH dehydrogenase/NADH:ubiquinone oxidoreductase subunit G
MLILNGALTSKPYAFTSRPWELRSVQSVDILDGLGSNIRIDFKESEILRILPRRNSEINESWISDKIRFFYDGLKRQRLTSPYIKKEGELKKIKWKALLSAYSSLLKVFAYEYGSSRVGVLTTSSMDSETLYGLRNFSHNFGFTFLGIDRAFHGINDNPKSYQFQSKLKDLEKADYCLFVGTNPRFEASVLNLRFRKLYRQGEIEFDSIGGSFSTTYPISFWGLTTKTLMEVAEGKHLICKKMAKAKNPVIVFGSKILERFDRKGLLNLFQILQSNFSLVHGKNVFLNPLHTDSNSVGSLEIGIPSFNADSLKNLKLLYFIGSENSKIAAKISTLDHAPFLVFQSSHGSPFTSNADFVFPSTTFVEKTSIYYNTEGRPQKTQKALVGPALAREDWKIVQVLSYMLNKSTPYSTKSQLVTKCSKILPSSYFANSWFSNPEKTLSSSFDFGKVMKEKILKSPFHLFIEDFYMTNIFCQSSPIMAKASESLRLYSHNYKFLNFLSYKK